MSKKFSLAALHASLKRGNPGRAWQNVSHHITQFPPEELDEIVDGLAGGIRCTFADVDPVIQEKFIGHMLIGCGREQEGKKAFQRAASWEQARERAQKEFGLDFNDYASLYNFLGANDFRDYSKNRDPEKSRGCGVVLDESTVAYLFFAMEMDKALPLVRNFPDAAWLTVGDGRHAYEARYLQKHGAKAFPTNLDPTLLEEAKELGLIDEYGVENLENLSFPDKSFDFICCKDSLHHSMFPYKGLYEMMRVARKGIFLIEPFDLTFYHSSIYGTCEQPFYWFEEGPGNYAYSFSEREMGKLGVAQGWKCLAVRGICCANDHPVPLESRDPEDLARLRAIVEEREANAIKNKSSFTSMCAILLRDEPSPSLEKDLKEAGYSVTLLPQNPHIKRDILKSIAALDKRI